MRRTRDYDFWIIIAFVAAAVAFVSGSILIVADFSPRDDPFRQAHGEILLNEETGIRYRVTWAHSQLYNVEEVEDWPPVEEE